MIKSQNLLQITQEIEKCEVCKIDKIGLPVPGEGNPDAKIVFIGEAPGKQEAQSGRPFIGRSGQLLRKSIQEIGLQEEDVFITSPVKYLPLKGTPSPKDISHGRIHLLKQLAVIQPQVVVMLGSVACLGVLGEKIPVSQMHGKVISKNQTTYFVTFHPAAAIRFTKIKTLFKADFQQLKHLISG